MFMAYETESEVQLPTFEPWIKYSSLTQERLSIVANIIRDVRHEAVLQHEPARGDTNWGMGCRVYERTCFALQGYASKYPDWLIILPETKGLQFSFAIGSLPFRFYRGAPNDPPDRYRISTYGELHHQQMCLEIEGFRPLDGVLRIAVETSTGTLEVTAVSVVEVDDAGNPLAACAIPLGQRQTRNITVIQAKAVELAPPQLEPLAKIEEVGEVETNAATEDEDTKADTGS